MASEFGKGLVTCLVKFAEHSGRWLEFRDSMVKESMAVTMHFNGASDHLYEIEVPDKYKGTAIETKVDKLKHDALRIGHGFTGETWTQEDVFRLHDLAIEIAMLIDTDFGLEPDKGQW